MQQLIGVDKAMGSCFIPECILLYVLVPQLPGIHRHVTYTKQGSFYVD